MDAKIVFNGIEITVPIGSLGDVVRQLTLIGSAPAAAPVAPKLSESAVPSLRRAPLREPQPDRFESTPAPQQAISNNSSSLPRPLSDADFALQALRVVANTAPTIGAPSQEVMAAFETHGPRGLGAKTEMLNRLLQKQGLEPDDVYIKARGPLSRVWLAGPRIHEAIRAIESDVSHK